MEIKRYIRKIVDDGNQNEMEELSNILVDVVNDIKQYDEDKYKEYLLCLYKMAYGNHLTENTAIEFVKEMKPYGMRWTVAEADKMLKERGLNDIDTIDFFYALNQAYNDFKNVFGDNLEMYIRYADAFINDEDARKGKITTYAIMIPR